MGYSDYRPTMTSHSTQKVTTIRLREVPGGRRASDRPEENLSHLRGVPAGRRSSDHPEDNLTYLREVPSSSASDSPVENRRKHLRTSAQRCTSIQVRDGSVLSMGVLHDVSAEGLAVKTDTPPNLGEKISVNVLVQGVIHGVTGTVTHITRGVRGLYTVGLHCGMLMIQDPGMLAIAMGMR